MTTQLSEGGSESTSGTSSQLQKKYVRKHAIIGGGRFRWSSQWEYISATMGCILSVDAFDAFVAIENDDTSPDFVHHIITFIFIGLPLYYVQTLLGQYTQLGTIFFKYLAPIGHGVGFIFITNLLLKTIRQGIMLSHMIVYFLSSIQKDLQWMLCPPNSEDRCWSIKSNCSKNCLSMEILPSTFIYYEEHYWEFPVRDPEKVQLAVPQIAKILTCVMAWITAGCLLIYSVNNYIKIVKLLWHMSLVLLTLLVVGSVLPLGSIGFIRLFTVYEPSLRNVNAWCKSAGDTVTLLGLGRAFHTVHGSFMKANAPSGMLSLYVVFLKFIMVMVCSTITETCISMIQKAAHLDSNRTKILSLGTGASSHFGVIPFAHGYLGFPQLWSIIFYATCILMLMNNLVTHFITMERSLSDVYPTLLRYKKYVLGLFCLASFLLGIMLLSRESYLFYRLLTREVTDHAEVFSCTVTAVLVFWVYGVQRFCDDIHFMSGKQPAAFWKICWYITPLLTGVMHICLVYVFTSKEQLPGLCLILYSLCTISVPIVAFIEVFRFVKQRNLVGLFQPEERFGPPDPHERYLRRLFNPRKEIRSKRRTDFCQHKCLVGSKCAKKAIQEENDFWSEISKSTFLQYDSDDSN